MYGQNYRIAPVNYYIFAFDSINPATLRDHIDAIHTKEKLPTHSRIDTVCILNKSVICNYLKNGFYNSLPEPDSVLVNYETIKSLLLSYTLLMHYHCQSNMPDFKFVEYLREPFSF